VRCKSRQSCLIDGYSTAKKQFRGVWFRHLHISTSSPRETV
jgi:hypothetical protein